MSSQAAFTNHVTLPFDWLFGSGVAATTTEVPAKWPLALNGRGYMLDTQVEHTFTDYYRHESIPLIRTQADNSNSPNEATLNPEGLWRRFQDSAHHGAGQLYLDRDPEADPYRFHTSKGIDPWTRYKLQLLPATASKRTSSNTNLAIVSAGARVYIADGNALLYSTDITGASPTFSAVTGTNASAVKALTSDGYNVYASWSNGIGLTNTSTGAITDAWNALVPTVLAYVKGRLMGTVGAAIYNVTAAGAAPTALFTQANSNFSWVGFAEGTGAIYAAGYSGDKSLIYRISVKPDASTLDQPIIAGELPDGEIVRSISGYLGFIVVGTDKGWRFCDVDGQGNLVIGLLVTTASAVYCFEPQDRFIWYGYSNYDSASTGLGRMDITAFPQTLTPAYATDLMATGQGTVLSVASFQNLRFFAISALGFYAETTNKVASGTLDTGLISFGIPDQKTSLYVDVRTEPLAGSYTASLAVDNGAFTQIGSESAANDTGDQFQTGQVIGQHFELRFTLTRSSTTTTTGPVFERWTMKAFPTLNDGSAETHQVPLLLYRDLNPFGMDAYLDVPFEIEVIKALRASRQIVTLQEFAAVYTGFVDDYRWVPYHIARDSQGKWVADGTMVIQFKRTA